MCNEKVSKTLSQKKKMEPKKCSRAEEKERVKEIKNNDHFAISWQITIHQIVQITDISQ